MDLPLRTLSSARATLMVGLLPGPHRRETGGSGRALAQRWLFQASAEGLGELCMQTIGFILAQTGLVARPRAGLLCRLAQFRPLRAENAQHSLGGSPGPHMLSCLAIALCKPDHNRAHPWGAKRDRLRERAGLGVTMWPRDAGKPTHLTPTKTRDRKHRLRRPACGLFAPRGASSKTK